MAISHITAAAPAVASPTHEQLLAAVFEMDCMAQSGFSNVATLARLALASLENPQTCGDHEGLAQAFEAILDKATATEDSINAMAEKMGCNYVDQAQSRRRAARRQARAQGV